MIIIHKVYFSFEISFIKLSFFIFLNVSDNNCPKENFTCANNNCLDARLMCDGNDDCGDNSDEGTICSGKNP